MRVLSFALRPPGSGHNSKADPLLRTVTFLSFSIIFLSTLLEFVDYRRVHLEPSIVVDRSRGEKLVVDMDIVFPRVPCYRESAIGERSEREEEKSRWVHQDEAT